MHPLREALVSAGGDGPGVLALGVQGAAVRLTLGGVAVPRSSLLRVASVGAVCFLPASVPAQEPPLYRFGIAMPSRWIDPSLQHFYLAPEGSAPGLAITSARCGGSLSVPGGVTESTAVWCTLTTPAVSPESRIHGWSLSLRAEGAKIVSARSNFAGKAQFERTEVTSGEGNVGVVSAVVLSDGFPDATAMSGGTFPVAALHIEATAPASGCAETRLHYEDGLRDSRGAVIRNEVLYRTSARLELEPCSRNLCAVPAGGREVCDNGWDDDGDTKIDLADTDCASSPHPGDCNLQFFECGGCFPHFQLFFGPRRPGPEVVTHTGHEAPLSATNAVPLRGFELSGRVRKVDDGFLLELTGDVPDEKGAPVRNVFLDTLGNRIPPLVSNAVRVSVGSIEAVERGLDLEPFKDTDLLLVDIQSSPTGPSFWARYVTDPASLAPVIPPITEQRTCIHRILTVKFGPRFHRGDANGDGRLDITDPIAVLLHLFGGMQLACIEAANADDDSKVDITDAIRLLMFLFATAEAPPHPGPPTSPCGHDRTWSTPFISCSTYDAC